ncbi:CHAT domain-containing protein [Maricaulis sp.]|uniref:CHAT domain-containing tetratricopeptide repeat protein n=1 Tax=Maricaulis sp. TaxID=1486257 RepID=UPI002623486C|nr:CHAT domain-containing protein [Maricaulis sp.]
MFRLICLTFFIACLSSGTAEAIAQKVPRAGNAQVVQLFQAGRAEEAVALGEQVLQTQIETLGAAHPATVEARLNLGAIYHALGRSREALPLVSEAAASYLRSQGPTDPTMLYAVGLLRQVNVAVGQTDQAISIYESVLELHEIRLGVDHPITLDTVTAMAEMHEALQQNAEALLLRQRLVQSLERRTGRDHPDTLEAMTLVATLFYSLARYDEAEAIYRDVLVRVEARFGSESVAMIGGLTNLGVLLYTTGRYGEAEPVLQQAIETNARLFGPDDAYAIAPTVNLATIYAATDRLDEAEPLMVWALELSDRVAGPDNPQSLMIANNLAALYVNLQRPNEAEPLFRRALATNERLLGPDHPNTLYPLNNLAALMTDDGRYGEAQQAFERAYEAQARTLGPSHPNTLTPLFNLAVMRGEAAGTLAAPLRGDILAASRERLEAYAARFEQDGISPADLSNPTSSSFLAQMSMTITAQLIRAGDIANTDRTSVGPAFSLAQAFIFSSAGDALRASTAALTVDDPQLRQLVDASTTARAELEAAEAVLASLLTEEAGAADRSAIEAAEANVANSLAAYTRANNALAAADIDLADIAVNRSASVEAVQQVLAPDEAVILYAQVLNQEAMMAFVVTPDGAAAQPILVTSDELAQQVGAVRAGLALDPGSDYQLSTADLETQPFDLEAAKALHDGLFDPLRPYLGDARRLLVVADGPLQTVPLHVLVSALPEAGADGFARYREARWLADEFAISRLPAVSSLVALRRDEAPGAAGRRKLIGFGNPVLAGYETVSAAAPSADEVFFQFANASGALSVEGLPALPQTGVLLQDVQATLGLSDEDIYLGPEAIEATLAALSRERVLADYRSVAFATHALINDEIDGLDEPAIVLTPTEADDGLLRASEVVGLDLDADLVILAACNTAAADGSPGAEALSGLAKAFFYSGARSLLVSNWPAEASATAELIPALVAGIEEDGLSRAQSLQQAMRRLRDDHPFDFYAHPALWAPFMVVADG